MEVPASRRVESAAQGSEQRETLAAESTAAETAVDLAETVEPEGQETELEPELKRAPLLEFWRRKDRGGPAI